MVYRLGGLYVISAITGGAGVSTAAHVADYLAGEKYVRVGDLDTLPLADSDERVDNGLVSRLSRGVMPTLNFM